MRAKFLLNLIKRIVYKCLIEKKYFRLWSKLMINSEIIIYLKFICILDSFVY